ncbi:oxidoreductase htatip2 [Capnocytophaga ochracea]|uniref:Oxidoreductase htatip2 n=1 Tax=Capnocytophaga ochracea TaxID=1018 RepID=A0A7Z9CB38_CAPOC|nr:NAD(P)H-binding protein [Capnocytophaga ochracea]VDG82727.1 oxidoreductase htatip2 [Capnocytophaga ochracea]
MKGLIIGATGATGKDLLAKLLEDEAFSEIHSFVRKPMSISHPKLHAHVVDFDTPEAWSDLLHGDVAFSCLGTTLAVAGSKDAQWRVDYDYQYAFAEHCKNNGVSTFVLVSAAGAKAQSKLFYNRMKGALEEAVKKLNFPRLLIFQPSILIRSNSDRSGENFTVKAFKFLNKSGILKRYRPMPTEILAEKILSAIHNFRKGTFTFALNKIFEL